MARPKTQDSVILEIKSARADGLTLDKIQDRMQETRDKGVVDTPMPGRGTVAKYTKEYDALPDSLKDLDKPFEYHLMETYGLPWEAGSYLLDMWVWVRESGPFPAMRLEAAKGKHMRNFGAETIESPTPASWGGTRIKGGQGKPPETGALKPGEATTRKIPRQGFWGTRG